MSNSEKAAARIEAEFEGRKSPDSSGSTTDDVSIPAAGLQREDVEELDYVTDVLDEDGQYRVYVKVSSDIYISST
ncbi:hypothetical protein [Halobaculum sp. EA56]|uniref:hypothetical protein n=1 Tax=Halobaculum sp. EA56 TaxID=3421648 RepID=UPI003EBBCF7A